MEWNLKVQWILKDIFISLSYIRPKFNNPGWQNNSASHNCLGAWAFAPLSLWLFLEQIIIYISSLNLFGTRDRLCERWFFPQTGRGAGGRSGAGVPVVWKQERNMMKTHVVESEIPCLLSPLGIFRCYCVEGSLTLRVRSASTQKV